LPHLRNAFEVFSKLMPSSINRFAS
jgi:hypothetical protein